MKNNITAKNITNEVPTAVWIATLIKTYEDYEIYKRQKCWIAQRDIQDIARLLCHKKIDNARISQWCNGDHTSNTYNYLRAKGTLRRLTKQNEFNGKREIPHELPFDELIFENSDIKLYDLFMWYKNVYCGFDVEYDENETYAPCDLESVKPMESEVKDISLRAIEAVKYAWEVFSKKVGGCLIKINKEASMQLHFSYVLQQTVPLIIFQDDEKIDIELETSISDGQKTREADIMMIIYKGAEVFKIAIELKCYKKIASSGGKRGATDIFMKDVYQDLHLLERYCEDEGVDYGIGLVMTDHKYFIHSNKKEGKCWDYDITHGTVIGNANYTTPIGGRQVDITLKNQYQFDWKSEGDYFFALLEKM